MLTDIKEIKEIRKKLGITQSQLAKHANVSQSLIAKIESGILDPSFSNATKLLNAINELSHKTEDKASDLMTKKIYSVSPNTSIKDAIKKLKEHGFSRLPVILDNQVIGVISERRILETLLEEKHNKVEEIMEHAPPVISPNTSLTAISNLLKYFSLVIVSNKGKITGVITKADVLSRMYK